MTFASKVLERLVTKRLVAHAYSFNLFPNKQTTYRCHYSTETAVLSVRDDIVRATDRNLVTGLLLLDLSSASDRPTVDHSVLGPFQFLCYAEDVCTVFDHHGV
jgi:hypothetical protein